jgi:hypothetical protein
MQPLSVTRGLLRKQPSQHEIARQSTGCSNIRRTTQACIRILNYDNPNNASGDQARLELSPIKFNFWDEQLF